VDLPAVRLGDSDRPLKGDPLHVFGYRVGKTSWEYVPGTVSDIETAADVDGRAWFDSNAPVASGFSGGAAVDDAGALVGVPTRLAADECASGSSDGGEPCLPTGGASLKLRPISLALPLLARVIPELVASLTPTRPAALQQTVEMVDINFKPKQLTILANTDVTINLVNEGALTHNFNIDQLNVHSGDYASDQTGTVTLNAAPGTYEYYCSIPGHKQAAMVGTLTVR